jgi:hypothetical protein
MKLDDYKPNPWLLLIIICWLLMIVTITLYV